MNRSAFILIVFFLLPAPLFAAEQAADTTPRDGALNDASSRFVTLASRAIIDDTVIRLGDIFQGVGKYADRVVAYAPQPGARAVFDARWLQRMATSFRLNWRPTSRNDRLVVERASRIISRNDIETILHQRLVDEGGKASSRVILSNRSFRLYVPVNQPIALSIDQLNFDPSNGRFTALLTWGNRANDHRRLSGRFERMAQVPVLIARVMRGSLISKSNIQWIPVPETRLTRTTITDLEHLTGMSAKRSLQPGRPVTLGDVRRPLLVNKGETVTLLLTTPSMQLSTKGRALQAGSNGDTIRISNLQSNTIIDAVITGPGRARVDMAVDLAMR